MTNIPARGSFAVVAYVPDPLASFLYELRSMIDAVAPPRPHITILPPRPLTKSPEHAARQAEEQLKTRQPFTVQLSSVQVFRNTNVIYIDIGNGTSELHAMHQALNAGELHFQEEFEYIPHLTVGGPFESGELSPVLNIASRAWETANLAREFQVDEIVFLWLQPGDIHWQQLPSRLGLNSNNGTGTDLRLGVKTQR